jgi:glucose-1-phosphate adenylyltransferase
VEPVNAIILGGGKGTRLYPLTRERAKPAVPFAGKYRLIDIPMSNCINSGFRRIYILTQFNTASLHTHLASTYSFDSFSKGVVEILAAEQTFENTSWYEGTADAVRKNFQHLNTNKPEYYIILSGDQLYMMDLRKMLTHHKRCGAEISIASTRVNREKAGSLGLICPDENYRIRDFIEKPGPVADLSDFHCPQALLPNTSRERKENPFLASMGMYIFNADVLKEILRGSRADFAKDIIPQAISEYLVHTYVHEGYWEDIGTIKAFYNCNINLTGPTPEFNFYDEDRPIYTHRKDLPATKMINCTLHNVIAAEGSILHNASLVNSVAGIRTIIEEGALLDRVICMGADFYETPEQKKTNERMHRPSIGIGKDTVIKRAIIDMNVRIGSNCRIGLRSTAPPDGDYGEYFIKDGIIIIPKGSTIQPGTEI